MSNGNTTHDAVPIVPQPERKVTIYSTKTGTKSSLQSKAANWGELKPELRKLGIDVDKMLVTETVRKTDLVFDPAELPATDFYIIARPKETKSGATAKKTEPYPLNRAELMAAIKPFIIADPKLKEKLGTNLSQTKTPELEVFHKKYVAGKEPKAAPAAKTTKGAAAKATTTKTPAKTALTVKAKSTTTAKTPASKSSTSKSTVAKTATSKNNGSGDVVSSVAKSKKEMTEKDLANLAKEIGIR